MEAIKVGYNLRRKVVLHAAWGLTPLAPLASPTLFGIYAPWQGFYGFAHHLAVLWIALGVIAVLGRTIWLAIMFQPRHGLV